MPNPKQRFTIQELNHELYCLINLSSVSSEGYSYRLDYDRHEADCLNARRIRETMRSNFEDGVITSEEYEEENDRYLYTIYRYYLVDEDDKICGEYFSNTRQYNLHYRRFNWNQTVYYRDDTDNVFTYGGRYVGKLTVTEDSRIILIPPMNDYYDEGEESEENEEDEDEEEVMLQLGVEYEVDDNVLEW